MAQALHGTYVKRAFVIHGADGWDEPTPVGEFILFDVGPAGVRHERRSPATYGLATCTSDELAGADAAHNAREMRRVLCGEDRGVRDPHRDALLLGAALALEVCGRERTPQAAIARAAAAIDSGAARELLNRLERFGAEEARRAVAS